MTQIRTLDVAHLPDYHVSNQAPLWWGQLMIAFIEGTMFCLLHRRFSIRGSAWTYGRPPEISIRICCCPRWNSFR